MVISLKINCLSYKRGEIELAWLIRCFSEETFWLNSSKTTMEEWKRGGAQNLNKLQRYNRLKLAFKKNSKLRNSRIVWPVDVLSLTNRKWQSNVEWYLLVIFDTRRQEFICSRLKLKLFWTFVGLATMDLGWWLQRDYNVLWRGLRVDTVNCSTGDAWSSEELQADCSCSYTATCSQCYQHWNCFHEWRVCG